MATLHLMVGLPGAGKTTLAKDIATQTGALRLTPDEWHLRLFGDDLADPDHDRRHDTVEALMWQVAASMLARGADVILDFGFWSRAERGDFAGRARKIGARTTIHYAEAPPEELLRRVAARNAAGAGVAFTIGEADLRRWMAVFEPPATDELDTGEG